MRADLMDAVPLSVAEYSFLLEDFDCLETILIDGTWPCSSGRHEDLGDLVLIHFQDRALLVRLIDRTVAAD